MAGLDSFFDMGDEGRGSLVTVVDGLLVLDRASRRWNQLVPVYLVASLAYHVHDSPVMSDGDYDTVCRLLDEHWDEVSHPHRDLVQREHLSAGTGYYLTSVELPASVLGATARVMADLR